MKQTPYIFLLFFYWCFNSCNSDYKEKSVLKENKTDESKNGIKASSATEIYYNQNKGNDSASISSGTYGNGKLINGKLLPFEGKNFYYFSEASYLSGRAYVNDNVLKILLDSYADLDSIYPDKVFYMMESSHKNGGKFFPHRTHQNGLSIDLMSPLLKDGKDYSGLDKTGIPHYWLEFDENGLYRKDKSVSINFNLIAHHLLLLNKHSKKYGYRIYRVHFKNDLHDELYATEYGKEMRKSGIVLTKGLSKLISDQHDDHFHVDFATN